MLNYKHQQEPLARKMEVDVEVNVDIDVGEDVDVDVGGPLSRSIGLILVSGTDQGRTIQCRTLILRSGYNFMFFSLLCTITFSKSIKLWLKGFLPKKVPYAASFCTRRHHPRSHILKVHSSPSSIGLCIADIKVSRSRDIEESEWYARNISKADLAIHSSQRVASKGYCARAWRTIPALSYRIASVG